MNDANGLTVRFEGRALAVASIDDAVAAWETYRDESGLGASDCGAVWVLRDGKRIARISYNGRVTLEA